MATVAEQIDTYLKGKGSPLAGHGNQFVAAGSKYGVDPKLIVAISGQETMFGKYGPAQRINNAWGYGPNVAFPSWDAGIDKATWNISSPIYRGKDTISSIGATWAPIGAANDPGNLNGHWTGGVSKFYKELGGNPSGSIRIGKGSMPSAVPGPAGSVQTTASVPAPVSAPSEPRQLVDESVRLDDESMARLVKWVDDSGREARAGRKLALPPGTLEAVAAARERSAVAQAQNLQTLLAGNAAPAEVPAPVSTPAGGAPPSPAAAPVGKWRLVGKPLDRPGMATNQKVVDFMNRVAGFYGRDIKAGTGTQHSQMTTSGNVSHHWKGMALDLPETGTRLTQMGQAALRAAGDPNWAKAKGGVYNVGDYQILFNTNTGGNHYNHLHVGLRQ